MPALRRDVDAQGEIMSDTPTFPTPEDLKRLAAWRKDFESHCKNHPQVVTWGRGRRYQLCDDCLLAAENAGAREADATWSDLVYEEDSHMCRRDGSRIKTYRTTVRIK